MLAATGVLFWLQLEPEEIYRRIRIRIVRPLRGLLIRWEDPFSEEREPLRRLISLLTPEEQSCVASQIIAKMNGTRPVTGCIFGELRGFTNGKSPVERGARL